MLALRSRRSPDRSPAQRRFDRSLVVVSLMIGLGLVLIIWGVSTAVTGDEGNNYPDQVESVSPIPDARQVPQQAQVVVDFANGYRGELTIDDIEIPVASQHEIERTQDQPGQQVNVPPAAIFEPGNDTLRYTPSDDGPIETLNPGMHTAKVVFWKATEGREKARSFTWTFEVV